MHCVVLQVSFGANTEYDMTFYHYEQIVGLEFLSCIALFCR